MSGWLRVLHTKSCPQSQCLWDGGRDKEPNTDLGHKGEASAEGAKNQGDQDTELTINTESQGSCSSFPILVPSRVYQVSSGKPKWSSTKIERALFPHFCFSWGGGPGMCLNRPTGVCLQFTFNQQGTEGAVSDFSSGE